MWLKKVCLSLTIVITLVLMGIIGVGAVGAQEKTETIDVVDMRGWVPTKAIWPIAEKELPKIGLKVRVNAFPYREMKAKQLMEAKARTGAFDVFLGPETFMSTIRPYLASFEDFLEKDPTIDLLEFKKKCFPSSLEYATFEGKLAFFPYQPAVQFGCYRKDLLLDPKEREAFREQYGYEMSEPDELGVLRFRSPKELLDVATFFTRDIDKDGKTDLWGYVQPGGWTHGGSIFEERLTLAGIPIHFDEEKNCTWGSKYPENQEKAIDIARFEQDLVQKYKVLPASVIGQDLPATFPLYEEGKAAMFYSWMSDSYYVVSLPNVVERIGESGTWLLPLRDPKGASVVGQWAYGISADSDNKEAAYKFIKWLMNVETQKKIYTYGKEHGYTGSAGPVTPEVGEWAAERNLISPAHFAGLKTGVIWKGTHFPGNDAARDHLKEMHESLLAGDITPEEFIQTLTEKMEKAVRRS